MGAKCPDIAITWRRQSETSISENTQFRITTFRTCNPPEKSMSKKGEGELLALVDSYVAQRWIDRDQAAELKSLLTSSDRAAREEAAAVLLSLSDMRIEPEKGQSPASDGQKQQSEPKEQKEPAKSEEKGGWTCLGCTFENSPSARHCQVCATKNPAISGSGGGGGGGVNLDTWSCPQCTLENSAQRRRCEVCDTARPGGGGGGGGVEPNGVAAIAGDPWACASCTFNNEAGSRNCSVCGAVAPITNLGAVLGPLMDEVKRTAMDTMAQELRAVRVEPQDIVSGSLTYKLGGLTVANLTIPQERVNIQVEARRLVLTATNIDIALNPFDWAVIRRTTPTINSGGKAACRATGVSIRVVAAMTGMDPRTGVPLLATQECTVNLGELDIKLSDSKLRLLYQLVISAFKSSIKQRLEEEFSRLARSAIDNNLSTMGTS